jgi:hypothetical protein
MSRSDASAPPTYRINRYSSSGKLVSSSATPVHVWTWGPDGRVYTDQGDDIVACDVEGHVLRRWGPFTWRTEEERILVVPSETEMYLLFTSRLDSLPVVERVSQKNGRVLARWAVK